MTKTKGNWVYYFSKVLKMEVAFNKETGDVMTEDKVLYTFDEIQSLKDKEITLEIHNVKKIFNGKVITNEQSKPEQSELF